MNNETKTFENKNKILRRLNIIEGQIKGLQTMVEMEKSCEEVLMQISAIRAALNKVGVLLLDSYIEDCLFKSIDSEKNCDEDIVEDFLADIQKFLNLKFNAIK